MATSVQTPALHRLRLVALPLLLAGGLAEQLHADTPSTYLMVDNGVATAQATVSGNWTEGAGELVGRGLAAIIEGKMGIGPGDFHISARFTVSDHPANRAGLILGGDGDFGLSTPESARVYVRGFLFGNMTMNLASLSNYGPPGTEITLECRRVGDHMTSTINGDVLWEMPYESGRSIGPVAIRAGNTATMRLKEFRFEGTPMGLDHWVHPHEREHPMTPDSVDVFVAGEGGYHTYRIPAIVRANSGTLLAFCEGRKNSGSDSGDIDLMLRRSLDGGRTWLPMQMLYEDGGNALVAVGNPVPVVDRNSGIVYLVFTRDNDRVYYGRSLNEGTTWSTRTEITNSVKLPQWGGWIAPGPGHGTQLPSGRLIFPAYHGNVGGMPSAFIIFTDDAGQTWRIGQDMGLGSGEPSAAVLSDGRLMMNTRARPRVWQRIVGVSNDWGFSWGGVAHDANLIEPTCQGSLLEARLPDGGHALLFSNPESVRRERLTVKMSVDDGVTWPHSLRIYEGSSGYSDVVPIDGDGMYGVLFERNGTRKMTFSPFHISSLLPVTPGSGEDQWRIE